MYRQPIPVVGQSKALGCSNLTARIAGSNPEEVMDVLSCVCCVGSDLCDELITCSEDTYRLCVCVCVRACVRSINLNNDAVQALEICCATKKKYSIGKKTVKSKKGDKLTCTKLYGITPPGDAPPPQQTCLLTDVCC